MANLDRRKNNGGARPNSGRKKTKKTFMSQKQLRELFHELLQANDCLAFREAIECIIEQSKSDKKAATYIIDQAIGRPAQAYSEDGNDYNSDTPFRIIVQK